MNPSSTLNRQGVQSIAKVIKLFDISKFIVPYLGEPRIGEFFMVKQGF
jgi:hypothetical protein